MKKARIVDATFKGRLKTLGLNISYHRKRRGLTQDELAELIDYSPSYLARVEACGENDIVVPTFDFVYKVVDKLGISIHDLVSDE